MMYKLKKGLLLALAIAVSHSSFADYTVKVFLDPAKMNIDTPDDIIGQTTLSNYTINRGENSKLIWDYNYLTKIQVSSDAENFSSTESTGDMNVNPLITTQYSVLLDNGKTTKDEMLTLRVIQPNPVINFSADKIKIGEGQSSELSWQVSDAESASLENFPIGGLNNTYTVTPANDTTYKLNVKGYNNENNTSRSVTIDVVKDSAVTSFTSDKTKVSIGDSVLFNWVTNDSEGLELTPFGVVDKASTSKSIAMNTVGDFTYALKTTSFSGNVKTSNPITVNVFGLPTISTYKVNNNDSSVIVEPNDPLDFTWAGTNNVTYTINGTSVSNAHYTTTADSATGSKNYVLVGTNGAGKTVNKTVTVNVVSAGAIPTFTGVSPVFANAPVALNWTGSNINNYKLSGISGSGIGSDVDMGTAVTYTVTPTTAGSYDYTLTGTNDANKQTIKKTTIIAEGNPTLGGFTVNGATAVNVAPNAALNFAGTGLSAGATGQSRTSANDGNLTFPSTAPATAGTYSYYMAATKTLNGVTRYSGLRSVAVTVVNAPTIGTITAPSIINYGSAFTLSWSGTDVANYTVKGNVAASGVAVAGVSTGTAASLAITPQGAGTFNYTITATNSAGVATSKVSANVKVENWVYYAPTYTGWVNNSGYYSCSAFSPDASTVDSGVGFYQTQYCYVNQTRTRQDRQQETGTGAVRNTTTAAEYQTLSGQPNTQYAVGTRPTIVCRYDASNQWQIVVVGGAQSLVNVVWNGGTKATSPQYAGTGAMNITQITGWDGKSYTRGPQVSGAFFQVCSTP